MAYEDIDRRRFLLLGLLTLIALPAIYFFSQRENAETTDDEAVATDQVAIEVDSNSNRPPLELTDDDPTFLTGPVGDANPGVNEIAVPEQPDTAPLQLSASYRGNVPGVRTCLLSEIGAGLTVTVRNLDNGRTVTCFTGQPPESQVADIVLHTDTFTRLADPTEAPITVEVTQ
ncbi:hypothetical protein [Ilumatobacter nonamiensis]|uniref:hypothetical protein n=1 Tax=Ilumatobacter nonamiensis TaxID=467093 RepID=UPI0003456D0C|nr:hypothetical protein [Ilumatobacter nonamiensis]